jgi:CBS domain containing-hemolysin-like protein
MYGKSMLLKAFFTSLIVAVVLYVFILILTVVTFEIYPHAVFIKNSDIKAK